MKIQNIVICVFALIVVASMFSNCGSRRHYSNSYTTSTPVRETVETRTIVASQDLVDASEQFDLRVLEQLLQETADAGALEKRLNNNSPALHNLDLDEDGKVDYIQVEEYGAESNRGLSLFVELPPLEGETAPQVQEIASIDISKETETTGTYEIQGNPHIYGHNHYYHSSFGIGDYLMLRWMFGDHDRYYSPYGYNRYPYTYSSWNTQSYDRYQSTTRSYTAGSSLNRTSQSSLSTSATSPNAGKNATNIKAPLKNPTTTQKSFQARNPSKQIKSGGFGKSTKTTSSSSATTSSYSSSNSKTTSSPSIRSSSPSRSGSFSGGGK
ncbi:hypothetical protein [Coraliomargarita parva]|uniref:hypothetical protein n=1 Tax=Coraliomargarita parva TaxID=3014050 RepID=UPI0022B3B195|nr:hypothetical protein [Coraliomargarita parva]